MKSTFRILFFARWESAKDNGKVPLQARITLDGDKAKFRRKLRPYLKRIDRDTDSTGISVSRWREMPLPALSSMPAGVDGAYVQIDGR